MPDTFFSQQDADVLGDTFDGAFNGFLGIYFKNQVHAALQVKPEVDRFVRPP